MRSRTLALSALLALAGCNHRPLGEQHGGPSDMATTMPTGGGGDMGGPISSADGGPRPEPPPPARACGGPSDCGFSAVATVDSCGGPRANLAFDVDGDGRPDWVQGCSNGLFVRATVVDGSGTVTFGPPRRVDAGNLVAADGTMVGVFALASGDVDGDGKADLVARSGDHLAVLRKTSVGLAAATSAPVPAPLQLTYQNASYTEVALGDIDGDGYADAVIDRQNDGVIALFRGQPDGTLVAEANTQALALDQMRFRLVDMDGDGRADLVGADWYDKTLLLAKGQTDGRFGTATKLVTEKSGRDVAIADFNGDGRRDIAFSYTKYTGNYVSSGITVALAPQQAGGSFTFVDAALDGGNMTVGDFNGDGHADVISQGGTFGTNRLNLFYGDGKGALQNYDGQYAGIDIANPWPDGTPINLESPPVADFNGDGIDDVLVLDLGGPYQVMTGSSVTPPLVAQTPQLDQRPDTTWFQLGDFDGDGVTDIVSGAGAGDAVRVRRGLGKGQLAPPQALAVGAIVATVGKFDAQPGDDLLLVDKTLSLWSGLGGPVRSLANLSTQGYLSAQTVQLAGEAQPGVVLASATHIDFAFARGDGTFADPVGVAARSLGSTSIRGLTGDFDCDHHGDLAVLEPLKAVTVRFGDGHGGLSAPVTVDVGTATHLYDAVAGDFDGDGCADLALGVDGYVQLMQGRSSRSFVAGGVVLRDGYVNGGSPYGPNLQAADFDGDGKLDLLNFAPYYTITLWLNDGHANFTRWNSYTASYSDTRLVLGDGNGDGKPDLTAVVPGGMNFWIDTF